MSAYVKFVCDYCGDIEIEIDTDFENVDSIRSARSLLREYEWGTFEGDMDMCYSCMWSGA